MVEQEILKIYSSTNASNIGGSTTVNTGTWVHAAITVAAGDTKIYYNGVQDGTGLNTLTTYNY